MKIDYKKKVFKYIIIIVTEVALIVTSIEIFQHKDSSDGSHCFQSFNCKPNPDGKTAVCNYCKKAEDGIEKCDYTVTCAYYEYSFEE